MLPTDDNLKKYREKLHWHTAKSLHDADMGRNRKSALPIRNYSQILYQF